MQDCDRGTGSGLCTAPVYSPGPPNFLHAVIHTAPTMQSLYSGFVSLAVALLVAIYISRALLVTVVEHAGGWSQVRSVLGTARSHITLALRESPRDTAHPVLRGRLFNN